MGLARLAFLRSFGASKEKRLCNDALFRRYRKKGDTAALSQLYNEHSNRLYYYLLLMSDPMIAADVTQKTWLKVIEAHRSYQDNGRFQAWLFTIGHRLLLDELKRNQRWLSDAEPDDIAVVESAMPSAITRDFHQLLTQLPFVQREAFSLQQEGFSLQEIANICVVPVETIKTRLRYARKTMRTLWDAQQ